MEILLVEDGLMDARVTILSLRRSGVHHRVTLVRTIDEAMKFLRREGVFRRAPKPDLLLLDLNLPDGSGVDLLRQIQSREILVDELTTVVLTANEDSAIKEQCAIFGANDYITKPVLEDKFLRVVRDHKRLMVLSTQPLEGPHGRSPSLVSV